MIFISSAFWDTKSLFLLAFRETLKFIIKYLKDQYQDYNIYHYCFINCLITELNLELLSISSLNECEIDSERESRDC